MGLEVLWTVVLYLAFVFGAIFVFLLLVDCILEIVDNNGGDEAL